MSLSSLSRRPMRRAAVGDLCCGPSGDDAPGGRFRLASGQISFASRANLARPRGERSVAPRSAPHRAPRERAPAPHRRAQHRASLSESAGRELKRKANPADREEGRGGRGDHDAGASAWASSRHGELARQPESTARARPQGVRAREHRRDADLRGDRNRVGKR